MKGVHMTYTEQLKQLLNRLKTLMYNWTRYKVTYITGGINNTSLFITKNGILVQKLYVDNGVSGIKEGDNPTYRVDYWILYNEANQAEIAQIDPSRPFNLSNLEPGRYRAIAYVGDYETESQRIEILSLEETPATTLVDIHKYLLEYTGLERDTQGDTFGYYLTGIAKMIRYLVAGIDINSEDTQSLDSIISMLEEFLNEPEATDVT
jgi:hypothetical protein